MMRMTRLLACAALAGAFTVARAQEATLTLGGGYAFADVEDADTSADGWRANVLYEVAKGGSNVSHGLSIGYVSTSAEVTSVAQTSKYSIWTVPITYAPKVTFGGGNLKAFVKGALGIQFSGFERTGTAATVTSSDMGFYAGVGVGAAYHLTKKLLLSAEYEFAYASNSYYRDGLLHSVMLGLGVKL